MNKISGDLVLRKALRSQLRMSSASTSDKYNYFQVCGQDVRPTNKVIGHSLLHVYAKWSMFNIVYACII